MITRNDEQELMSDEERADELLGSLAAVQPLDIVVANLRKRVERLESMAPAKAVMRPASYRSATGAAHLLRGDDDDDDVMGFSLPSLTLKNMLIGAAVGFVGYRYLGGKKLLRKLAR